MAERGGVLLAIEANRRKQGLPPGKYPPAPVVEPGRRGVADALIWLYGKVYDLRHRRAR